MGREALHLLSNLVIRRISYLTEAFAEERATERHEAQAVPNQCTILHHNDDKKRQRPCRELDGDADARGETRHVNYRGCAPLLLEHHLEQPHGSDKEARAANRTQITQRI